MLKEIKCISAPCTCSTCTDTLSSDTSGTNVMLLAYYAILSYNIHICSTCARKVIENPAHDLRHAFNGETDPIF